jgi:hypothetical protein
VINKIRERERKLFIPGASIVDMTYLIELSPRVLTCVITLVASTSMTCTVISNAQSFPFEFQLLFEELKLDTKLPAKAKIARTSVNHQKSTSESVLIQLKEVHPLPGLILEYRQVKLEL